MGASFNLSGLASRTIAREITKGEPRLLKLSNSGQSDEGGGILSWIVGGVKRFGGFVLDIVARTFSFSLTALWSLFVSTVTFIWNFNWNSTDEQLDQQVNQAWTSLAGMAGGTLGNSVGYLLCGILPGAAVFSFNEALGLHLLRTVGEEALEELAENVAALIRATINATVRTGFTYLFKNTRAWLKNPDNPLVKALFGDKYDKALKAWGAKGSKPWSFASALEDAVESIPNEALRNFVEEFLEEAWEGCIESGYLFFGGLQSYAALQKAMPPNGHLKVIEVKPNRENDDERYVLAGGSELVKPQLVNLLSNHQLIQNYDLGTYIGDSSMLNYFRAKPMPLMIKLEFASVSKPPWNRSKQKALYQVPDVERSKLDYAALRTVCGGANGMMYGPWRASYDLDNGRPIWAFGSTADEAEDLLNRLLTLTSAKPLTYTPKTTRLPKGKDALTGAVIDDNPIRVYPRRVFVLNQEKTLLDAGRQAQTGKYIRKKVWLDIYSDNKPYNFDAKMQALLERSA